MSSSEDPLDAAIDPAANFHAIEAELKTALAQVNRPPDAVVVTAVAKRHDKSRILPLLQAGHRIFGENRVQEAAKKWPPLIENFPDVQLRLVGPLQSNKAKDAVALFHTIETVDRPKIARALAEAIIALNRTPRLLVQVNTGEEGQKSGIGPGDADAFIAQCRDDYKLPIVGLMCIPPRDDPPAPHFALLAKIAARNGLAELSMGMSADFAIAAQLGATHVRIGTAIFGERPGTPSAPTQ
ncbi:MAG: YggS family pyridoxal phosphate-dependent enzyme [Pseudomonadota bacterium]